MSRRATTSCVSTLLLMIAGGCGPTVSQQRAQRQEDFRDAFVHRDVDSASHELSHPKNVLVAQGYSPVVFDVREASTVHVMDLTSGVEIASTAAGKEEYVSVNEQNGVLVGNRRVVAGPLPKGHEFGILLDVAGDESFKSKVVVDSKPPARLNPIDYSPKAPTTRPIDPHPFNTTTQPAEQGDDSRSHP